MTARRSREVGAATVELAVLFSVLVATLALVYPLGQAFIEKMRVGRAAGTAARYAAADPNSPEYGTTSGTSQPTASNIVQAADDAYVGDGGSLTGFTVNVTLGTLPGTPVSVNCQKSVDLGPLGSFLQAINVIPSASMTVSATATNRQE